VSSNPQDVDSTQASVVHDHSLEPVAPEQRQSWYKLVAVAYGWVISISGFLVGGGQERVADPVAGHQVERPLRIEGRRLVGNTNEFAETRYDLLVPDAVHEGAHGLRLRVGHISGSD
jgi:hypothetical protein